MGILLWTKGLAILRWWKGLAILPLWKGLVILLWVKSVGYTALVEGGLAILHRTHNFLRTRRIDLSTDCIIESVADSMLD